MNKKPDLSKWTLRIVDGDEVWRFRKDGITPTRRPIRGALKRGEWLCVPTLVGHVRAKVVKCGDKTAYADSGGIRCELHIGKEADRRFWVSSASYSKKVFAKFRSLL